MLLEGLSCFNKGKLSKSLQFGRAFQLGRIGGNFPLVGACTSLRMEDKTSVRPVIVEPQGLFGDETLTSCGTDKGYDNGANHKYLRSLEGLKECCLQQPGLDASSLAGDDAETHARLVNRRAGIETLIGHAKHGGQLGKSRMKHDDTTLAGAMAQLGASICANFSVTYLEKTSRRWGEKEHGTAQSPGKEFNHPDPVRFRGFEFRASD